MVVYISEVSETHNSTSVLVVDDILLDVHLVNEEENHLLPLFIALRFQQLQKMQCRPCYSMCSLGEFSAREVEGIQTL